MTFEIRKRIRAVADQVLADREDRAVLRPVLVTMLKTAVQDFERYHQARHASLRVRDHDILMAVERARREANTPPSDTGTAERQTGTKV